MPATCLYNFDQSVLFSKLLMTFSMNKQLFTLFDRLIFAMFSDEKKTMGRNLLVVKLKLSAQIVDEV